MQNHGGVEAAIQQPIRGCRCTQSRNGAHHASQDDRHGTPPNSQFPITTNSRSVGSPSQRTTRRAQRATRNKAFDFGQAQLHFVNFEGPFARTDSVTVSRLRGSQGLHSLALLFLNFFISAIVEMGESVLKLFAFALMIELGKAREKRILEDFKLGNNCNEVDHFFAFFIYLFERM